LEGEYPDYKIVDYLPDGIEYYSFNPSDVVSTTEYTYTFKT
jgi:hypothetical protein